MAWPGLPQYTVHSTAGGCTWCWLQEALVGWAAPPSLGRAAVYVGWLQAVGAMAAWYRDTPSMLPLHCVVHDAEYARQVANIAPPPLSGAVHEA